MTDKELAARLLEAVLSNHRLSKHYSSSQVVEYVTACVKELNKAYPLPVVNLPQISFPSKPPTLSKFLGETSDEDGLGTTKSPAPLVEVPAKTREQEAYDRVIYDGLLKSTCNRCLAKVVLTHTVGRAQYCEQCWRIVR